jgi:hypothetical protein
MVSVVGIVGTLLIVGLHTLTAGIIMRFLRLRLASTWGQLLFALVFIPLVLLVGTLVLSGGLGLGVDLGSPVLALGVTVLLPLLLGVTIEFLYMEPPAAQLPAQR